MISKKIILICCTLQTVFCGNRFLEINKHEKEDVERHEKLNPVKKNLSRNVSGGALEMELRALYDDGIAEMKRLKKFYSKKEKLSRNVRGAASLMEALLKYPQFKEIASIIIEEGTPLETDETTPCDTVLHVAVKKGLPHVVEALLKLQSGKELLEVKNCEHHTPLQSLVVSRTQDMPENAAVLRTLLQAGANVEAETNTCRPLHWAAQNLDAEGANALLAQGADINAQYTEYGVPLTPLELILTFEEDTRKQRRCLAVFVSYGANLTPELSEEILRRFWPYSYELARSTRFDNFDDFYVRLTTGVSYSFYNYKRNMRDLVQYYDKKNHFALYRILKNFPAEFPGNKPAILEPHFRKIFRETTDYDNFKISGPRKWEMERFAWNVALAAHILGDYENKEIMARKTSSDPIEQMNLYVLDNILMEEPPVYTELLHIGDFRDADELKLWNDGDISRLPRKLLGPLLIHRLSKAFGQNSENLWKFMNRNYCPKTKWQIFPTSRQNLNLWKRARQYQKISNKNLSE